MPGPSALSAELMGTDLNEGNVIESLADGELLCELANLIDAHEEEARAIDEEQEAAAGKVRAPVAYFCMVFTPQANASHCLQRHILAIFCSPCLPAFLKVVIYRENRLVAHPSQVRPPEGNRQMLFAGSQWQSPRRRPPALWLLAKKRKASVFH